ncbi:MAG: UDP-N-acetylglucosamine 1-carboxyvinyltransferase [Candidatus Omnitrophica bacterium]|nr:UDP-N-acetylglucosamine 1-carboxyvinyltransferase [Candidatus Omnitrophota bacterium]
MIIKGGRPLKGKVKISGSKNAILPILAATLLTNKTSKINGVPDLWDVHTMVKILRALGVRVQWNKNTLTVAPGKYSGHVAPYKYVSTMRASICVLGALLAKHKKAEVSLPGGCVIGIRPIDLHLKGLKALGAEVKLKHGYIRISAKKLKGNDVYLGGSFGSSVLATANVMMAAVKARGKTIIENAAAEPEIVDLALFLNKMGAKISGHGSHTITIEGVKELGGANHTVIPDRIEAGTYMIAAAITGGDISIEGVRPDHVGAVIDKLKQAGVKITKTADKIRVRKQGPLNPVDVTTLSYPGFPTDMQAQMMALMSIVPGISIITEKIYPERFMHAAELNRMGSDIGLEGPSAIIKGVKKLSGAPIMASDLRASAALVLAGLAAQGQTEISRIYHLDRGYENMEEKLSALGADIKRMK